MCQEAPPSDRHSYTMRRATGRRDQAILLTMLDTGLRASELCALTVGDVGLKIGKLQIKHGLLGGAKGGKGQVVCVGEAARRTLWRYLAARKGSEDPSSPIFLGRFAHPLLISKRDHAPGIGYVFDTADVHQIGMLKGRLMIELQPTCPPGHKRAPRLCRAPFDPSERRQPGSLMA